MLDKNKSYYLLLIEFQHFSKYLLYFSTDSKKLFLLLSRMKNSIWIFKTIAATI